MSRGAWLCCRSVKLWNTHAPPLNLHCTQGQLLTVGRSGCEALKRKFSTSQFGCVSLLFDLDIDGEPNGMDQSTEDEMSDMDEMYCWSLSCVERYPIKIQCSSTISQIACQYRMSFCHVLELYSTGICYYWYDLYEFIISLVTWPVERIVNSSVGFEYCF